MKEGVDDDLQTGGNVARNAAARRINGASQILDDRDFGGGNFRNFSDVEFGLSAESVKPCASCASLHICRPEVAGRVRSGCVGYEYEPGSLG